VDNVAGKVSKPPEGLKTGWEATPQLLDVLRR
jgi:hypothetical protein